MGLSLQLRTEEVEGESLLHGLAQPYYAQRFITLYSLLFLTPLSDTDSLIYEIEHPDVYAFMKDNISHFDTSNFAEDNEHGVPRANASIVLKMKDEAAGIPIAEFVSLGAKQYTFQTVEDEVVKKAKGVKKNVVKRSITIEDYKEALFDQSITRREQATLQSKNHNIYTIKRRRVALQSKDDKRVEIENYRTLPYGHVDLGLVK